MTTFLIIINDRIELNKLCLIKHHTFRKYWGVKLLDCLYVSVGTWLHIQKRDMCEYVITDFGFILCFQDLDETLSERLWGLTEMFPEGVRNATHNVFCSTTTGIKGYIRFHSQYFCKEFCVSRRNT